ncbi:MAG: zinc-binding alcohol dehydrogenase family protein [Chitinophagaceae bacterium]
MKSLICITPGKLEYREQNTPLPGAGQALLKTRRIGICGTDLHAFEGTQPYFTYPRILGHELAAELVEGPATDGFSIGDPVTFIPYFNCGICIACRNGKTNCCETLKVAGVHIDGGMVEYLTVPANLLVKGNGLDYDALALVEPLAIGAHAVRRANIEENECILVIGAGPIGIGIMEFAAIKGARVIALDTNEIRLAFCRNHLSIQYTINASLADAGAQIKEITNGNWPDVVIDATGNVSAITKGFNYISHGGRYILVGLQKGDVCFSHPEFHRREATLMSSRNATRQDFEFVIHCILNKKIKPANYITHRTAFDKVKDEFASWLNPASGVIKAIVEM